MTRKRTSLDQATELVRLFLARSQVQTDDPSEAVRVLTRKLRADSNLVGPKAPLDPVLRLRDIDGPEFDKGLSCDGCLVPKGDAYANGFRVLLRAGVLETRTRFTLAHEICHSFFYELASEIKFQEHYTDDQEERLCNIGAAELLMPTDDICRDANCKSESLFTLSSLAALYAVSLDVMITRLRTLRHWSCDLSVWRRLTSGEFALDRKLGRINDAAWQWRDSSVLDRAWSEPKRRPLYGRTFVGFTDSQKDYSALVYYEVQRRGDALFALWSRRKLAKAAPPLFRKQPSRSGPASSSSTYVA
jgi:IrrE N-terminal-like domain